MARSTVAFVILCAVLAAATATVVWQLITHTNSERPGLASSAIHLGRPDQRVAGEERLFDARSVLLWDTAAQHVIFEEHGYDRVPIASLTKLMTAMVALDYGVDWDKSATIELHEYVRGGRLLLHPGEEVTLRDLFNASLVGSANNATLAYVRTLGVPEREFVQAMNRKAIALGLEQTEFVEVTGLDPDNLSTAYEIARVADHAYTQYPAIAAATSQSAYTFTAQGSGREHTIKNTNPLVADGTLRVKGSKTGYLDESLYCLVVFSDDERAPNRLGVILGSPSEFGQFTDMQRLLSIDQ